MIDTNYKLIAEMEKAEHALMVHADGLVTKEVLNSCLNLVEQGKALELFLDIENKVFLEENSFLLNKCFQLINTGASVFFVSNSEDPKFWKCIIDFKEVSYYSHGEVKVIYEKEQDILAFQNVLMDFERKRQEGRPLLVGKKDIHIRFNASEHLVMMGDTVELSWEVDGADKVIIQGLGKVEAYSKKKIRLDQDTILKIGGSNEIQSQIKALFVRVSEANLKIPYDIGFISAGTKQYNSLVNSDIHPHVYGVSAGNLVKLTWNVPVADELKISPFNIFGNKGEYIFTATSSINIEIQVQIRNRTYLRKIQVLVFPIPLFKEKIVTFNQLMNKKYELKIPVLLKEKTEEILSVEKQRYLHLSKRIFGQQLAIGTKKLNLNWINIFLFDILKNKHSHRKGILNELKSIEATYEQPTTTRGNGKSTL